MSVPTHVCISQPISYFYSALSRRFHISHLHASTTDLLLSTGVAILPHSGRACFNPPLRSSLSDYPEASWLQHSSLHDHRRPSSLFLTRSSRRTVRVHKRSPTLANHAFHCSQVASRAVTLAVCGRSGCSSRLHSGYSSNLLQSVHPPRQKTIRRASTIVALPSAAPTSRFWSHRVGLPLESDYSRGFLACVVSSTAQFVSRSTAAGGGLLTRLSGLCRQ